MIEDELKKIWQSSANEERIKFDKSRLILNVQSNLDHFQKAAWRRDIGEMMVGFGMIPILIFGAWNVPGIVAKIAMIWMMLGSFYIAYRFRASKKHEPHQFTSSFLDFIQASRDYLSFRKRLWDTSLYWYILPCFSGALLLVWGFFIQGSFDGKMDHLMACVIAILGSGVITHVYNMNLMKRTLLPKLKKVDQLIATLKEKAKD